VSVLEIATVEPLIETVEISSITRDVVVRAKGTNKVTVAEYAQAMREGAIFPPVVLYKDRTTLRLAEGAHRIEAALAIGLTTITAEIRSGGIKPCIEHAVSSGRDFGLRFSTRDKRFQIELMLGNFPKWSDRKIAEALGVDHKTVAATKRRLAGNADAGEIPQGQENEIPASGNTPTGDLIERQVIKFRRLYSEIPDVDKSAFSDRVLAILSEQRAE
jgi:hypothetical protein